jgi:flagellar motor switch protein FliN/FliY
VRHPSPVTRHPSLVTRHSSLGAGTHDDGEVPMAMLLDLTLPVSIELGRTSMTVQEILRLGRGSVIQLERLAGEPIDIYVGDRRFAEGEVVVLGEHFGVRITRILARSRAKAQHA